MASILWVMVLCLLLQSCLCSVEQTNKGCKTWSAQKGSRDVCCDECHPGNRMVRKCGSTPSDLCTPCEPGTFLDRASFKCARCTQCVGALVQVKACTATSDTVCRCEKGLRCGDDRCSFCVMECVKGEEPADQRSCRPCPEGTFNNQIHQKCKPWSTKCPHPHQYIEHKGDAFSDIKCANASVSPSYKPTQPGATDQGWPLVIFMVVSIALMGFTIIVIITMAVKILQKKKKSKKPVPTKPIIRMPTDDPRTLIAIECSFHEAQQEQGSSTESLDSKDSSDRLIA
ncbi:tumor necrosis factor receptor superfamily member 9a [Anabas testudineus]|uniref:TNFR-Cys domain-containing protein n=1 Tax=Anabas testudineus TaxID=64144 RepID=A0A3Q1KF54_ANATE|nr:tumor necrosis factor receptor superfamily member 9a [Anabas testudineus]